jgi:hypothetical protein
VAAEPDETGAGSSRLDGWAGFWLWALVGGLIFLGFIGLLLVLLIPGVVLAIVLARLSSWKSATVLLGFVSGVGLPLLAVAADQWSNWHHRAIGDGTPNPYYWGCVGLLLVAGGAGAYGYLRRRAA